MITELHICDFSKSSTSGVAELYRGKFLGACQSGTHNSYGDETGFDYLKKLGISHVQLQPIFDHHQTFDADGNYAYNGDMTLKISTSLKLAFQRYHSKYSR